MSQESLDSYRTKSQGHDCNESVMIRHDMSLSFGMPFQPGTPGFLEESKSKLTFVYFSVVSFKLQQMI